MTLLMMFPHMWEVQDVPRLLQSHRQEIAGLIAEWDVADVEYEAVIREIQVLEASWIDFIWSIDWVIEYFKDHKLQFKLFAQFTGLLLICWILYAGKESLETPMIKWLNNVSINFINNNLWKVFHVFIAYLFLRFILSVPGTIDDFYDTELSEKIRGFIDLHRKQIVALEQWLALWYILVPSDSKIRKTWIWIVTALVLILKLTDYVELRSPVTIPYFSDKKTEVPAVITNIDGTQDIIEPDIIPELEILDDKEYIDESIGNKLEVLIKGLDKSSYNDDNGKLYIYRSAENITIKLHTKGKKYTLVRDDSWRYMEDDMQDKYMENMFAWLEHFGS